MIDLALKLIEENKRTKNPKLDLGNTGLQNEFPRQLFDCIWLEELILSSDYFDYKKEKYVKSSNSGWQNSLDSIPREISSLRVLKILRLKGISSVEIRYLSALKRLEILDLSDCRIWDEVIPSLFYGDQVFNRSPWSSLTRLQTLSLNSCQISDTSFLKKLTTLKVLDLSNNQISDVKFLERLTELEFLNLNKNQISDITFLKNLNIRTRKLYLSENQISDIKVLSELPFLEKLDISYNKIDNIEVLLPFLQQEYPTLSFKITATSSKRQPEALVNHLMPGEINICGNPWQTPPPEVIEQGSVAIINYFKELEKQGTDYLYEAKMLIVGQPRAGKTSLRYKLFDTAFPLPGEESTTRGIDIEPLDFEITDKDGKQHTFKYNIWDFGGQQIYQTTHQFFLTKRSLYVLVLDTGKGGTGNDDNTVNYWLQAVELLGGNSPMLLVRNEKNERQVTIDLPQKRARFPFLKTDYSIDLNALIPGTSTYKQNRADDFNRLKEDIQTELKRLPLVGFPMPGNWVKIREALQELAKDRPYISRQEYIDICRKFAVTDFERQMELSRIFHDLGVFLHFQDYDNLEDFIVLQNVWATDAVFAVLDNKTAQENKGRFTDGSLAGIWSTEKYDATVHKKLLALMMQFELCYKIDKGKNSTYIVPEMLDNEAPANYKWNQRSDLTIFYWYDFMPKGLLTRLIVRLHHHIEMNNDRQSVWKTGVKIDGNTMDCPGSFAEITEAWDNKQLTIRVQGNSSKELLSKLTHEADTLNNEFFRQLNENNQTQKSRWRKMIPCICDTCKSSNDKYYYDYAILQRAKEKRKTMLCEKSFEDVSIAGLIDGIFSKKEQGQITAIEDKDGKKPVRVFISYAHSDNEKGLVDLFVKELKGHLKAWEDEYAFTIFKDDQIIIGDDWDTRLQEEVKNADIAILLLSSSFLQSEYINKNELGVFLERNTGGNKNILCPIYFDPFQFKRYEFLKNYQFFKPLGNVYGPAYAHLGDDLCYGDLVQFDPQTGVPQSNGNRSRYMIDFVEALEKALQQKK